MKRYGVVLTFKPGTTKKQAEAFVKDDLCGTFDWLVENPVVDEWKAPSGQVFPATSGVHEYNDEEGGPVWYVP